MTVAIHPSAMGGAKRQPKADDYEASRTLMTSIGDTAGTWRAGVAARRDAAVLLMGFAGAHRRSELVALTLEDVTLHPTDGLHVRVRRSKTDREARGTMKALP